MRIYLSYELGRYPLKLFKLFLIVLSLSFAMMGCTGLAGEPEIVATQSLVNPPTDPQAPADVGYPLTAPDLASGAATFAQHCTACHGIDGRGDGELVLNGQVPQPSDFHDPATAREQSPKAWFDTITQGNLEQLMPPWANALTEQQRWDVALYTYTLHYTAEQLNDGSALQTAHNLAPEVLGLTGDPQQAWVTQSDAAFTASLAAQTADLSDGDRAALVAYLRTQSLQNTQALFTLDAAETADAAPTPTSSTPESAPLSLAGSLYNRTSGATVPAQMSVKLHVFDAETLQPLSDLERTTTANPDLSFAFDDITLDTDKIYMASVEYQGHNFGSGIFAGDPALNSTPIDLSIGLAELTDDPDSVIIDAAVSQVKVGSATSDDMMEVVYSVRFVNTSDKLYKAAEPQPNSDVYTSIYVDLPPGALIVAVMDEPRALIDRENFRIYDTLALQPGESRFIQVTYLLSYSDGAIIEYPMPFNVNGQVRVLLQPDSIQLTSEQLPFNGEEMLGNIAYQGYGALLTLPAETLIRYELGGDAPNTNTNQGVVTSNALLPLALLGGGVILVIIGVLAWRGGGKKASQQQQIDSIMQQIAALDAQHDAGQINHDLYQQRRTQLKARLAALMDGTQDQQNK